MTDFNSERSNTLDRRRVLQGAAWAAPVVALSASAPMASASPCSVFRPGAIIFAGATPNYTRGPRPGQPGSATTNAYANVNLTGGGTPVQVNMTSSYTSTAAATYGPPSGGNANNNLRVNGNALELWQRRSSGTGATSSTAAAGLNLSITFDRRVRNVVIALNEFTTGTFIDAAWVSPSPNAQTPPAATTGSVVRGSGTQAAPWFATVASGGTTGTAKSFTISNLDGGQALNLRYFSSGTATYTQALLTVTGISFEATGNAGC